MRLAEDFALVVRSTQTCNVSNLLPSLNPPEPILTNQRRMKMKIKSICGDLLFESTHDTMKATLECAVAIGVDLKKAKLQDYDLSGANLVDAKLHGANLYCTNLCCARLHRADLSYANLSCSNLTNAHLDKANLYRALLRKADLKDASLQGSNLLEAQLMLANLNGANLDDSCLPLWYGGQFEADSRICKQLAAHTLRIMENSGEGTPELLELMGEYIEGWHQEDEF